MISHPLVKKEWKSLKWLMLLYACIFTFFTLVISDNMAQEKTAYLLRQYQQAIFTNQLYGVAGTMVPMLLISMMVLVGVLFSHDRNSHIGKFISSLPYTRREQFKIKYLMGMSTFTVPLIVFAGALYMIRMQHQVWISRIYQYNPLGELLENQDSARTLLLWLVFIWLIMLVVYSFLMMVQSLIGQNIVGSIIGGVVFFVPLFLGYAVPANLSFLSIGIGYFTYVESLTKGAQIFLGGRPEFRYLGNVLKLDKHNLLENYTNLYGAYDYQWFPLYMVVLIIAIIISTILANYFISYNDVEKNGEIALYPWVGKLLIIGSTLCSLLLLPIIIVIFTGIENSIITLISMAIGAALGYFFSSKSVEMTTKHG